MVHIAKYNDWLTDDALLIVEGWAREGLSDLQIAKNIGISESTMTDWKSRFSAFSAALKKGKAPVDLEVENALLKRALGYDYEETVTEVYDDANGVSRKHVRRIKKHMPSDPASMFFWLKNRRPDRWRDKRDEAPAQGNELLHDLGVIMGDGESNV